MTGWGYKQIARLLTTEGLPCPSAHDRARYRHRPAHAWTMSAVRAILANPCYLGYHVSGRTKKADVLIDPDRPALGDVTRQHWQDQAEWVTSSARTYEAQSPGGRGSLAPRSGHYRGQNADQGGHPRSEPYP